MKPEESKTKNTSKILFVEPFSGISGDMLLGALLDLGGSLDTLREKLGNLSLHGYRLSTSDCLRAGIRSVKFDVHCEEHHHDHGRHHNDHGHHHRSFRDIRGMIEGSGLSDWVKGKSMDAFGRLAAAEGKIHGQPAEEVHFHEVGAVDSIVDMVGTAIALEELMPVRILSAEINVGQGILECRHGNYPAPGPATMELLKGIPIYGPANTGELTTPTGAALLATFSQSFGSRPRMTVERIGYGAGSKDFPGAANVLRVSIGNEVAPYSEHLHGERVAVIEASVDDMNPQIYGYFQERALAAGALDVLAVPVQMKKNRPGIMLSVLCDPEQVDSMTNLIFSETTTIGVRYSIAERRTLAREFVQVETGFGSVTIKVASSGGRRANFTPEYECCRKLALDKGVALKDVMAAAVQAYLALTT